MRYSAFASCIVAVLVSEQTHYTQATPLAPSLAQLDIESAMDLDQDALELAQGEGDDIKDKVTEWVKEVYSPFKAAVTKVADNITSVEKIDAEGKRVKEKKNDVYSDQSLKAFESSYENPGDDIFTAINELLAKIDEIEQKWALTYNHDKDGNDKDYCHNENKRQAKVQEVSHEFAIQLDKMYRAVNRYQESETGQRKSFQQTWVYLPPLSEQELRERDYFPAESVEVKDQGKKSYLDAFVKARAALEAEQKKFQQIYLRDMALNAEYGGESVVVIQGLLQEMRLMTGQHRGFLAVPNDWANKMVNEACAREGKDPPTGWTLFKESLVKVGTQGGGKLLGKLVGDEDVGQLATNTANTAIAYSKGDMKGATATLKEIEGSLAPTDDKT